MGLADAGAVEELKNSKASISQPGPTDAERQLSGWAAGAARLPWFFILIVVLPFVAVSFYYLLIATPVYVSEARFVVRSRGQAQPAALGSVLQSVGVNLGQGQTDAYEVHEYMTSRDATGDLVRAQHLRALLSRPEADVLARFPRPFEKPSFENLFRSYKRFVVVGYDSNTGISTLRVKAFRAADAHAMAEALLDGGEAVVNRLNDRAQTDAVAEARRQVIGAEGQGLRAEAALTAFRNHARLIDPTRSSLAGLELVGKLEGDLATMRAEKAGLIASAPDSPQLPVMDRRIKAYAAQIELERSRVAGEADSLAPQIGEYERLALDRDFAQRSLAAAVTTLEAARLDVHRKQLYLERVVSPNLPDKAEEPRRFLAIVMVLVSALLAYGTVSLLIAGLREHRQS